MAAAIREQITGHGFLYGLLDPRDGMLRYIGQTTVSTKTRFHSHLADRRKKTAKGRWINDLRSVGLRPELIVLGCFPRDVLDEEEIALIALVRSTGAMLYNLSRGGGGCGSENKPKRPPRVPEIQEPEEQQYDEYGPILSDEEFADIDFGDPVVFAREMAIADEMVAQMLNDAEEDTFWTPEIARKLRHRTLMENGYDQRDCV